MRKSSNLFLKVVDAFVSTIRDVLYFVGRVALSILTGGA